MLGAGSPASEIVLLVREARLNKPFGLQNLLVSRKTLK